MPGAGGHALVCHASSCSASLAALHIVLHTPPNTAPRRAAPRRASHCRCILANREPFAHKEWRKTPFTPRPYTLLTDYAITTNVPLEVCI
jgi:hypothetical protein